MTEQDDCDAVPGGFEIVGECDLGTRDRDMEAVVGVLTPSRCLPGPIGLLNRSATAARFLPNRGWTCDTTMQHETRERRRLEAERR